MIIDGDNQDKFDVSLAELEKMLGGGLTAGAAAPAEQQLAAVDAVDWDAVLSAVDAPVGTTGAVPAPAAAPVAEQPVAAAEADALPEPVAELPAAALTSDADLDALLGQLGSPATDELPVELPEPEAPAPVAAHPAAAAEADALPEPVAELPAAALTPDADLDALLGQLGSPATDELPVELPEPPVPVAEPVTEQPVAAEPEPTPEPVTELPEAALTPDADLDALLGQLGSLTTDELPAEADALPEPVAELPAAVVPDATVFAEPSGDIAPAPPEAAGDDRALPAWGAAEAGIDTLSAPVLPVMEQEQLAAALSGLTAGAAGAALAAGALTPAPVRVAERPAPPPVSAPRPAGRAAAPPAAGLPPDKQVLACLKAGMFREAQGLLKQLIVASPSNADHYFNLSVACQRLHDRAGTRAALERCLELDPHQYRAMCNLAGLYYEDGDLAGAQELLEQAVSINPFDTHSANNLRLIRRQRSGTVRDKRRVRH